MQLNLTLFSNIGNVDAIILAVLFSTIIEEVLTQVVSHTTSFDVWLVLETKFFSQSCARIIQLRTDLANSRIGALSANNYFMQIKHLTDELAIAGQALKCDEVITYLLTGLIMIMIPLSPQFLPARIQ